MHKLAILSFPLHWRHNDHDGVSNHQPRDCLLNRYSGADHRKHQSSASLAFVRGIHRGPVNSPHKWPVTRKMIPFDDVIMRWQLMYTTPHLHGVSIQLPLLLHKGIQTTNRLVFLIVLRHKILTFELQIYFRSDKNSCHLLGAKRPTSFLNI